ncbi:MAG: CoA transferase [Chloroflexi bacterium]|nr:CoA transferase [Chloroflexota bacterium]MYC02629.1 CoA transferase [Chloroflexota bacterium]
MTRPLLDGIRVLDFTQFQQGPSATVLMSDLGAEVIKVERLKVGDPSRHVAKREDGFSQYFHTHHRGKRSIAVDLRSAEGRDLIYELVERVDVVTENFKPGVMNRLGLGWDDLKQRNPKLVYASASGFGPQGPRANATSWASVAGAAGGGMWPNGVRGENGVKPYSQVAAPDPDQTGGMIFAFAIASALVARERTGEGQLVQTSLYGSQIWGRAPAINAIANGNIVPSARNMPISNMFTLQAQGSDDDWLFVGYITDRWVPMCRALEREDLVTDERFSTLGDRNANLEALRGEVATTIATRPAAEWPARFDAEEVPSTLIQDYPMIAEDDQAAANEYIVQYEDERFGTLITVGSPIRANGVQGQVKCLGPELGQDTDSLLEEIGCGPQEIARLKEVGVVG